MKKLPKHRSPHQQLTDQNLRDTPRRARKEFLERLLGPALLLRRFHHFFFTAASFQIQRATTVEAVLAGMKGGEKEKMNEKDRMR